MIEIRLVKYQEAETQLLALFLKSFGHDMTPEQWNWKHQSYLARPEVIVAVDGDRIVGARPFQFVELWLGEERVSAAQHVDTMVDPEYQGQGIFNRMGQYSIGYLKDSGYAVSYGFPNRLSRAGFLKQGYKIVGPTETMLRIVRPRNIMSHRLKNRFLGNITGLLYAAFYGKKLTGVSGLLHSFRVSVSDLFNEKLNEVDTLQDEKTINMVRNEGFLKWRFDNHPLYKYKYIAVTAAGKLTGYAVISNKMENRLAQGQIIDFLVKNGNADCFQVLLN